MQFLRRLNLGARLALGFGLLLLLLAIVTGMGIARMSTLDHTSQQITTELYTKANASQRMSYLVLDIARAARNLIILEDQAQMASNKAVIDKNTAEFADTIARLRQMETSPATRSLIDTTEASSKEYLAFTADVTKLGLANQNLEGQKLLFGPRYKIQGELLGHLAQLVKQYEGEMQQASVQAHATFVQSATILGVVAVIAVLVGVVGAILITRSITGPMSQAVGLAQAVAEGDLTRTMDDTGRDEAALLLHSLQTMNGNLTRVVHQIRQASDSIATGSSQIASGNADLSQRTESQASSLQQTAASMEEMSATIRQNADTARTASQLASTASQAASRGGDVMGQVVATMQDISGSSNKIADIIGVIDGIAFQTNILALNAAVEAARAGEQGRGFAVVASEVRALAGRSAEAAKEIKNLIGQSVEKVGTGTRLVDEAGATMSDIVQQVQRVSDLIAEIDAATREQSEGIGQVNSAVSQLDQATQQNAALVEESAAAAGSLQQQAVRLTEAVGVFRLSGMAERAAPAPAPVHAAAATSQAIPARPAARPAPAAAPALGARKAPAAQLGSTPAPPARPAQPVQRASKAPAGPAAAAPKAPALPAAAPKPAAKPAAHSNADDDWTTF
ncbi:methyl-accepting chemotaxis protein [Paracidovorax avenae]|uniref:methyl-accepting chemotaxis protein n=3 Tax=Paracidovorax avenae TaxID=80867 RepID=UPI000D20B5C0|nr:methyl-accepting chemotaxis protein [Paracidovorax avenae]AVS92843.1 methyl-accepting chemotaxis protein [Paracidovorax avenae]AVT04659.1 methyl-accepting chemotaxis protein [Paracidovorax avenae]